MAYRSYVIVATICLFLLTSDIETMIIYVIINLFSETDVFVFGMACKSLFQLYVGEKMSDLYNIEGKGDYLVYTFDGIALKIKSIENEETDRS